MWTLNFHCILPLRAPPVTLPLTPFNYIKLHLTPACRMSQDCPRTSLMGSSGHPVNPSFQDVPGLSQDVPHGILRTSSQPQFVGCPRTVPGRPSWDPLDIQSTPGCRMSQDYPRTSLMGSSLANPLCPDSPGMCPTLVGNTGHLSRKLQFKLSPN